MAKEKVHKHMKLRADLSHCGYAHVNHHCGSIGENTRKMKMLSSGGMIIPGECTHIQCCSFLSPYPPLFRFGKKKKIPKLNIIFHDKTQNSAYTIPRKQIRIMMTVYFGNKEIGIASVMIRKSSKVVECRCT